MIAYEKFLTTKELNNIGTGFNVSNLAINKQLYPFQGAVVKWALQRGRVAIFADCGLGKTPIQLEWAKHITQKTGKPVLIFAPLAVSMQTKREGDKFHIPVSICRKQKDIKQGINITNYEMIQHFDPETLAGIVLDESSILKGFERKFRQAITDFGQLIPFRLACTATPAPNDLPEIINHSEFLGVLSGKEVLGCFFIQDGNTTHKWRLKGHAEKEFWKWLSTWAVAFRYPSDLNFEDDRFFLPPLNIHQIEIGSSISLEDGQLFNLEAMDLRERQKARRQSIDERIKACKELIETIPKSEQWLIWCDLNEESRKITQALSDAVEIKGADSREHKEKSMLDFQTGKIRILVTKPSIAGFGMNWQNCSKVVFLGLSDSYEKLYQATRRCWRFGQLKPVDCYYVISKREGPVVNNVQRKEKEAQVLYDNLIKNMNLTGQLSITKEQEHMKNTQKTGDGWRLFLGDSIDVLDTIEKESIGLTIFSPPFPGMYVYTDTKRDIGNSKTIDELINHFKYMIPKLLYCTMPGRSCCIHLTQAVTYKYLEGFSGMKDFRGMIISAMEQTGWIYYGEVCIDKNPQVKAVRTKDHGLLFKTLSKDASALHPALADYLIQFRKKGNNPIPIRAGISTTYGTDGWITPDEWIEWAAPVWYRQTKHYPGGIKETDVLETKYAKDQKDEKHLAPLQLGVIERAVKLWSNPGDIVLDPFAGIGSTGYVSLRLERRFIGIEIKESYFNQAIKNFETCQEIKKRDKRLNLFQAI